MGETPFFPLSRRRFFREGETSGFSLLELLVVMGIIILLAALAGPALSGIGGAQDMTKSAYDVAGLLEQARAYAMSKNTYVYVGLAEAKENETDVTLAKGGGRLVVVVLASKTGVRPLNMTDGTLLPVSSLKKFENVKLETVGTEGNLEKRKSGEGVVNLSDSSPSDFAGVVWNVAGGKTLTFEKVIEFDPSGVARFTDRDNIDGWLEIPIKPAHSAAKIEAALQVDSETGSVQIYRP